MIYEFVINSVFFWLVVNNLSIGVVDVFVSNEFIVGIVFSGVVKVDVSMGMVVFVVGLGLMF